MIVVTGGAGFIGSNLVAALEARGEHDIVVCDRLGAAGKWQNLAKRELAGIVRPEAILDFLDAHAATVNVVFHLGAISDTREADADRLVATNLAPTLDLWRWCTAHGARLIYASSAATYGDGGHGFDDDPSPEALARLRPLNAYAWSKHAADRRFTRLAQRAAARPAQWAGLKFFNVYGPNEYHKEGMRSVVVQIHERIVAGEPARLFRSDRPDIPDGGQTRDFIWVEDCVDVMLWLYDNPQVSGLFNVGTGRARSFADLAGAVFAALDRPPRIDYVDMPAALTGRYQYFTEARTDRLRAAGYDRPFTGLEDGVRRYVRDFLAASDPYR
ncbi:MAG: ADP-glyceromanno-heptose 6-epimerase [Alphaproteobacteria bacterium]